MKNKTDNTAKKSNLKRFASYYRPPVQHFFQLNFSKKYLRIRLHVQTPRPSAFAERYYKNIGGNCQSENGINELNRLCAAVSSPSSA